MAVVRCVCECVGQHATLMCVASIKNIISHDYGYAPIPEQYTVNKTCIYGQLEKLGGCSENYAYSTAQLQTTRHNRLPPTKWHWTMIRRIKCAYVSRKQNTTDIPPITINDTQMEQVNCARQPGVTISNKFHIDGITAKASKRLYFIILFKRAGVESNHPLRHRVRLPGVAYKAE